MNQSKPEEAMTFGELLTLIHQQQQRLQVLETSFTQLVTLLDPRLQQQLIGYLSAQSDATDHTPELQQQYAALASEIAPAPFPETHPQPDAPGTA